jgi:hypothetical protein
MYKLFQASSLTRVEEELLKNVTQCVSDNLYFFIICTCKTKTKNGRWGFKSVDHLEKKFFISSKWNSNKFVHPAGYGTFISLKQYIRNHSFICYAPQRKWLTKTKTFCFISDCSKHDTILVDKIQTEFVSYLTVELLPDSTKITRTEKTLEIRQH